MQDKPRLVLSRGTHVYAQNTTWSLTVKDDGELSVYIQPDGKASPTQSPKQIHSIPKRRNVRHAAILLLNDITTILLIRESLVELIQLFTDGRETILWSTRHCMQDYVVTDLYLHESSIYLVGTALSELWYWPIPLTHQPIAIVGFDGKHPTIAVDDSGVVHICTQCDLPVNQALRKIGDYTKEKINRVIMYGMLDSMDGNLCYGPSIVAHGISGFPSLVLTDNRPLVVFQADAAKRAWSTETYLREREGAGASIGFALGTNIRKTGNIPWQHGTVAASKEILVRETGPTAKSYQSGTLMIRHEWHGHPVALYEQDGTPFVTWIEESSRHILISRWLGEKFEPPVGLHPQTDHSEKICAGLQNHSPYVVIGSSKPHADTPYLYKRKQMESLQIVGSHLDVDDRSTFSQLINLTQHIVPMDKNPDNPFFLPGPDGSWDADMVSFPYVIYVPERNTFALFYSGGSYSGQLRGWHCGYAESIDGYSWQRKPLWIDGVQTNGNHIPYLYPFRDELEPNEAKRYKSFLSRAEGGKVDGLAWSSDCRHWFTDTSVGNLVNGSLSFTEIPVISFRNGDGMYHVIGRVFSPAGRALGMQRSENLVDWLDSGPPTPSGNQIPQDYSQRYGRLILDSSDAYPHENQIYYGYADGTTRPQRRLFYAPCSTDGRYALSLAISRDDMHFERIAIGEKLVPCGKFGAWDNGFIAAFKPVEVHGFSRLYYGSSGWHHNTDKGEAFPLHRPNWKIGSAEILSDRMVALTLDGFGKEGLAVTKYIEPCIQPRYIELDFDGPAEDIDLEVGLRSKEKPLYLDSNTRHSATLTPKDADFQLTVRVRSRDIRFYGFKIRV